MAIPYMTEDLRKRIGKKLFGYRYAKNETIKSVAISIKLSISTISKIENGRYPSLTAELITRFAHYYRVPVSEIMSLEDLETLGNY